MVHLADIRGKVEAAEGRLPLVVRYGLGLGEVPLVRFALDRPLITNWRDRRLLFARLLQIPTTLTTTAEALPVATHFGYEDLAGQLRRSLDRFPGVFLLPFGVVVALMLVHILLIGPADYLLIKRLPNHRWVAWITLVTVVGLLSGLAYLLVDWTKGRQVRIRQLDLVDVACGDASVRGISWVNVFSPVVLRADLTVCPRLPGELPAKEWKTTGLSWWGLPGEGFGGMNSLRAELFTALEEYQAGADGRQATKLFFRPGTSKLLACRWAAVAESPPLTAQLNSREGELPAGFVAGCRLVFPIVD